MRGNPQFSRNGHPQEAKSNDALRVHYGSRGNFFFARVRAPSIRRIVGGFKPTRELSP